jgi:phage replication-related protein YjqB (UPF0714/DUF867 family)
MTRIRYKQDGSKLVSAKSITCKNFVTKIVLHLDTMKYQVVNLVDEQIIDEGTSDTIEGLKKSAKNSVRHLGANFFDEIRKPDKKIIIGEL